RRPRRGAPQGLGIIRRLMPRVFAVLLVLLASRAALADAPTPPALGAKAWLLFDATSGQRKPGLPSAAPAGQRLAGRNPEERIEPASLTKLMTAYIAFSALRTKSLAPG